METTVARETRTVRERVGVFDASTLGKIEVVGPGCGRACTACMNDTRC